jgi:hypothetical protein
LYGDCFGCHKVFLPAVDFEWFAGESRRRQVIANVQNDEAAVLF